MIGTADNTARKRAQRTAALSRRDALYHGHRARASAAAGDLLQALLESTPAGRPVSAFIASRSEIDLAGVVRWLQRRGTPVGMPVVVGKAEPLVFRRYRYGDALISGSFGIPVPRGDSEVIMPSVFLVPLAAFDRRGYRIGYGGGFYDRTLARARAERSVLAIGVAFACQEVGRVASDAYDQPVDLVVTEREVIPCR